MVPGPVDQFLTTSTSVFHSILVLLSIFLSPALFMWVSKSFVRCRYRETVRDRDQQLKKCYPCPVAFYSGDSLALP